MEQQKIDRINALAHKQKTVGLTEAEQEEQKILRQEFIQSYVGNLRSQLEQTYIMDEHGQKHKLRRKEEQ